MSLGCCMRSIKTHHKRASYIAKLDVCWKNVLLSIVLNAGRKYFKNLDTYLQKSWFTYEMSFMYLYSYIYIKKIQHKYHYHLFVLFSTLLKC